ncbi:class I SAM-dependent methyltransferase [Nocardiopsis sp. ARC36]
MGFATRLERGEELSLVQSLMAANRHVLDVGGGIGELSRAVAARIGHCTTVEPHAQLVESMRDEAAEAGVSVFAGTAEDLPFPDASFDAVYGAWVLPFVDDVEKAVTEMVRVCDPGAPEAKIVLIVGGADSEVLGLFNDVCAPVSGDPATTTATCWRRPPASSPNGASESSRCTARRPRSASPRRSRRSAPRRRRPC